MTTIINPASPTSVVYNQGGSTIAALTASGTDQASATQIARYSQRTVLVVTNAGVSAGVVMPSNSDVGDVIEIYPDASNSGTYHVWPASGDQFGMMAVDAPINTSNAGLILTLLSAGHWGFVKSA